jgi:hypothetical protein
MRRFIVGLAISAVATFSPTWAMADDQQVANQIAGSLRESGRLVDYSIGVSYKDGTAVLHGRVTDDAQVAEAIEHVQGLPEVTQVVNKLTTGPKSATLAASRPTPVKLATRPAPNRQTYRSPMIAGGQQPMQNGVRQVNYGEAQGQVQQPAAQPRNMQAFPQRVARRNAIPVGQPIQARPGSFVPAQQQAQGGLRPVQPNQQVAMNTTGGGYGQGGYGGPVGTPVPAQMYGAPQARYDHPHMPNHAWPSYAAYPNYAAVNYPRQYSPTAWPYIGPFYPYPQVPLGWRKVSLEWDDGWWMIDFDDKGCH